MSALENYLVKKKFGGFSQDHRRYLDAKYIKNHLSIPIRSDSSAR